MKSLSYGRKNVAKTHGSYMPMLSCKIERGEQKNRSSQIRCGDYLPAFLEHDLPRQKV